MNAQALRAALEEVFPQAHIEVISPDEVHYEVLVVSDVFQDLNRLARERRVTQPLKAAIQDGSLHALRVKTHTFDEWKSQPWKANSSKADTHS